MTVGNATALRSSGKLAIVCGGILPAIAAGTMAVMLPGISDAFRNGASSIMIKMVATALGLGMMVGAPLGGLLADRSGRFSVLAGVTILFGLFGVGAMFATELWELIVARFIVGVACGAMTACYVAVIGDNFSDTDQSRWLGLNAAVATISIVILNPIAGMLVDAGGWQHGFIIYSAALPIVFLVIVGIPRGAPRAPGASAVLIASPARYPFPYGAVFLAVLLGTVSTGTTLYWPFRLREVGITSARDLALYALPNVMMITIGALCYGSVRRHLSIKAAFMAGGIMSAGGLIIMAAAGQPWQVAAGLMFEGLAIGLLTPNLAMFAISISPPERRARTVGLLKGAVFGSPFLTQFALEPMSRAGGASAALVGIAAIGASLAALMLLRGFAPTPPQVLPA